MAIKGLTTPVFGDYGYDGNKVSYSNGFVCSSAIEYSVEYDEPDSNDLYGDDRVIESDNEVFTKGTLALSTSDLTQLDSKRLLGLKQVQVQVGEETVTENVYDSDAKKIPKGFGIIETHQINNINKYRAVILCRVNMNIPGEAATTKGETIEWQTKEIGGNILRSDEQSANYNHPWMRDAWFDTQQAAKTYLQTMLNAIGYLEVSSVAGSTTGETVISVTPAAAAGNSYVYKAQNTTPSYNEDLTSWTALTVDADMEIADGTTICVAEVTAQKKAVAAGIVVVSANKGE